MIKETKIEFRTTAQVKKKLEAKARRENYKSLSDMLHKKCCKIAGIKEV